MNRLYEVTTTEMNGNLHVKVWYGFRSGKLAYVSDKDDAKVLHRRDGARLYDKRELGLKHAGAKPGFRLKSTGRDMEIVKCLVFTDGAGNLVTVNDNHWGTTTTTAFSTRRAAAKSMIDDKMESRKEYIERVRDMDKAIAKLRRIK